MFFLKYVFNKKHPGPAWSGVPLDGAFDGALGSRSNRPNKAYKPRKTKADSPPT